MPTIVLSNEELAMCVVALQEGAKSTREGVESGQRLGLGDRVSGLTAMAEKMDELSERMMRHGENVVPEQ